MKKTNFATIVAGYKTGAQKGAKKANLRKVTQKVKTVEKASRVLGLPVSQEDCDIDGLSGAKMVEDFMSKPAPAPAPAKNISSKQRSSIFGSIKRVSAPVVETKLPKILETTVQEYMDEVSEKDYCDTVSFRDIKGGCMVTELLDGVVLRSFFLND